MLNLYEKKRTPEEQLKYIFVELHLMKQALEKGQWNPLEMPGCYAHINAQALKGFFEDLVEESKKRVAQMPRSKVDFIFTIAMNGFYGGPEYNFDKVDISQLLPRQLVAPSAPMAQEEEEEVSPAPSAPPVEEAHEPQRPYLNPHLAPIVMPWPEEEDDFLLAGYRRFRGKNNAPRDYVEPPLPIIRNAADIGRAGQITDHDMVANSAFGRSIANNRSK